mmetsp:Transcript_63402/g.119075  ORF Transcript_63402/g.119075 Transcript_63402/m.119075 type:complete len:407 (-) Transcript_63402:127-1347(-)
MISRQWLVALFALSSDVCLAFVSNLASRPKTQLEATKIDDHHPSRRAAIVSIGAGVGALALAPRQSLALGTLPETQPLSRAMSQMVVRVTDTQSMVAFCVKGLGMAVRRSYSRPSDGVLVTILSYGPEEFAIPAEFVPGISSFAEYGSHFSLQLEEAPGAAAAARGVPEGSPGKGVGQPEGESDTVTQLADGSSDNAQPLTYDPGNGVAYLALGVPQYRISKLLENGGNIISSYGYSVVVSPCGLTFQVVLGDQVRDPFMFAALRVTDVKASEAYYTKLLGMKRFKYPKARPALKSAFEPPQPRGSVFLSYSEDSCGVLLLPNVFGSGGQSWPKGMKKVQPGNVVAQLRIVTSDIPNTPGNAAVAAMLASDEPDGYGIGFIDSELYSQELLAGKPKNEQTKKGGGK